MHKKFLLPITAGLLIAACGGAPPEAEEPRDTGAGTVLKVDGALDEIVPQDYRIEKLADGLIFTEGPLWVSRAWEGAPFLLFSDVPGNAIYKWDPAARALSDFKKPVFEGEAEEGRFVGPNGLTLDQDGNLFVCEHGNRRISKVTPAGVWSVFVDRFEGKRLNSPNDLVWHKDGWLYFTDPPYGLAEQDDDDAKELDHNGLYRVSADGGTIELLDPRMTRPNGLGFSPDYSTLYVANSDPGEKVWRAYQVREDGTIGLSRTFYDLTSETAQGLPDGLKLDKNGNLYATGPGGVWIFTPDGKHLGTIQPEEVPANVAWGDDGKTLYMTARTGLYRIKLNAEGALP